jgi:hypothetical protein
MQWNIITYFDYYILVKVLVVQCEHVSYQCPENMKIKFSFTSGTLTSEPSMNPGEPLPPAMLKPKPCESRMSVVWTISFLISMPSFPTTLADVGGPLLTIAVGVAGSEWNELMLPFAEGGR